MAVFTGQYAQVKLSGTGVVSAGEAFNNADSGAYFTYRITNQAHSPWDRVAAITVYKNGVAQSSSTYRLDRLWGYVIFNSALLGTDVVTADVTYLPMTVVANAKQATLTHTQTPIDTTVFNQQAVTRIGGIRDAQGSLDRFYDIDLLFTNAVQNGVPLVVEYWRDQTHLDWRAWALFSKTNPKATPTTLVDEQLTWVGAADADNRSVSYG